MLRIANLNLLIAAGNIFRNSWGFISASHTKLLCTINCAYIGIAVTEDSVNQTEHKFQLTSAEDFETVHPKPAHIMNSIKTTETTTGVIITDYCKQEINIFKFFLATKAIAKNKPVVLALYFWHSALCLMISGSGLCVVQGYLKNSSKIKRNWEHPAPYRIRPFLCCY